MHPSGSLREPAWMRSASARMLAFGWKNWLSGQRRSAEDCSWADSRGRCTAAQSDCLKRSCNWTRRPQRCTDRSQRAADKEFAIAELAAIARGGGIVASRALIQRVIQLRVNHLTPTNNLDL